MERVEEIREKRERVFYKQRMAGNRARALAEDRKLVDENQHLLPPSERYASRQALGMEKDVLDQAAMEDEFDGFESDLDMAHDEEMEEEIAALKLKNRSSELKQKHILRLDGSVEAG